MKEIIIDKIKEVINTLYKIEDVSVILETPKQKENGQFSTPVVLSIVKQVGKNPRDIAKEIIDNIDIEGIEKIEIGGPGFLNFFVDPFVAFKIINKINAHGEEFGKQKSNGQKVLIEYISANPTGWLHIGHARNAAFGSSLHNIKMFAGYEADAEYYINDHGTQMELMRDSVIERYKEVCGKEFNIGEDHYKGNDIKICAEELKAKVGDKLIATIDTDYTKKEILEFGYQHMLTTIKQHLKELNIHIPKWFSERSLYPDKYKESVEILKENGYIKKQDGATFCLTTMIKDDKDRVIIKQDGNPTYFCSDIAYHHDKSKRGYDQLINVWGADHDGYIDRVNASVMALGRPYGYLVTEVLQMVSVTKNGEQVKMSKRMGTSITIKEMIDEIGSDALRYFLVSRTQNSPITIDLVKVKETNNDNPLFYIQYAHARCNQLLNKQKCKNITQFKLLSEKVEGQLLKVLYKFEDVVTAAAKYNEPHRISNYVYDLASAFHKYYNDTPIITNDSDLTNERINFVKAVKIVLANSLKLIGVNAPDTM